MANVVRDAIPFAQSIITPIVGGFITAMFLRGNTHRKEFEKIKIGKIDEAIDNLVDSHELTLTELVKCKNLIKIAKIADNEYKKQEHSNKNKTEFDFDWFLRFFEGAGNVSNEYMQLLWARILAGEANEQGSYSLRAIDTLRNMTSYEASILNKITQLVLSSPGSRQFLYCTNASSEIMKYETKESELNEAFGISDDDYLVMTDFGILNPVKRKYLITWNEGNGYVYNRTTAIVFENNCEDNKQETIEFYGYALTQIGNELVSLIDIEDNNYTLELGLKLKQEYPNFIVKTNNLLNDDGVGITIDDYDLLKNYHSILK
jgi:hypothetical protein